MSNEKKKFKFSWNKKASIITGCVVGVLAIAYVGVGVYFQSHFAFNTSVNGVAASKKTVDQVQQELAAAADGYTLKITGDKKAEVASVEPSDIDMTIEFEKKDIKALLDKQNGFAWPKYLFASENLQSSNLVSFDKDKLKDLVANLDIITDTDKITETTDATLGFDEKNGGFKVVEEVYGNNIDLKKFQKGVNQAVTELQDSVDATEYYVQPKVTSDDKDLADAETALNKVAKIKITYTVGDSSEKIPADTIASWLSVDSDLNVVYDDEKIADYVATLAEKYNTAGKSHPLATSYGTTVNVPSGNYGWKLDQSGEISQLKKDLEAGKDVNRDLTWASKAASHGSADYGNSYVEINITAQHLFLYVNGSRVLDTPFVSGNVAQGNNTPSGTFKIAYKEKNATLKGPTWESKVSYWMPFNGGIGLHDANWRSVFGGQIYKTNGSHGCVNLPPSVAGQVFNNVSAGMPVLVYTLPGTESGTSSDAANAVIDKIQAIGDVTLDKEAQIAEARNAYNGLSGSQKAAVPSDVVAVLSNAEAALETLKGQQPAEQAAPAPAEAAPAEEAPAAEAAPAE